jgi:hypothetical protein
MKQQAISATTARTLADDNTDYAQNTKRTRCGSNGNGHIGTGELGSQGNQQCARGPYARAEVDPSAAETSITTGPA